MEQKYAMTQDHWDKTLEGMKHSRIGTASRLQKVLYHTGVKSLVKAVRPKKKKTLIMSNDPWGLELGFGTGIKRVAKAGVKIGSGALVGAAVAGPSGAIGGAIGAAGHMAYKAIKKPKPLGAVKPLMLH